jgi:hypothetical protein
MDYAHNNFMAAFPVGYQMKKNQIAKSGKLKFSWEPPTGTTLRKIIPVS